MQHESAADGVVDVTLVCIDEVVGAVRRWDDSHNGDFACVYGVHMPDEPVAFFGREEGGHDNPPIVRVLLPLLGGKAHFRIHSGFFHVLWQCVFGVKDYVMLWLNIVDVLGLGGR